MKEQRIPGVEFDEVLYADDSICAGRVTRKVDILLAEIERVFIP